MVCRLRSGQSQHGAPPPFDSRAVQNFKQERNPEEVSEADLFNYILEWKKLWKKDEAKQGSIAEAIRNLEMLGSTSSPPPDFSVPTARDMPAQGNALGMRNHFIEP